VSLRDGLQGPDTHAGCSTRHFNEIPDVWPIGIGAPCIGCTEKSIAFRVPMFKVVQIHTLAAPPSTYAPINAPQGIISPLATVWSDLPRERSLERAILPRASSPL